MSNWEVPDVIDVGVHAAVCHWLGHGFVLKEAFEATWVNTRSGLRNLQKSGSCAPASRFGGSDRVQTGSPGSGPPPNPELDFGSGSLKVRVRTKVQNQTVASLSLRYSNMGWKLQRLNSLIILPSHCYMHQLEGNNGSVMMTHAGGCLFSTFYQSLKKLLLNVASLGTLRLKHSSLDPSDLAAILV